MWEGLAKEMGQKKLPSAGPGTRQRIFFKKNLTAWASSAVKCHFCCRVLHSAKRAFAECRPLPSARLCQVPPGPALGKEWLRRVPNFWHSAKLAALGKSAFSRSDLCIRDT